MRNSPFLTIPLLCAALIPVMLGASPAAAESRIFIIANQPDGYGVDLCLAKGERCGETVARSYCQSKEFAEATEFRKIEADDVTGALSQEVRADHSSYFGDFVAITCRR
jgi:hypothetical protein